MANDPFERVREAVAVTFGIPAAEITRQTTQNDLPGWDSVGHLNLMLVLEESFGLSLEIADMEKLTSVEAIVRAVAKPAVERPAVEGAVD
jgi:acyl carrier protein